ncbi:hypothetical protein IKE86_02155 [Candidatus Saccharibacteria bacterium]|nr:hypothetical protein [Candidatus Saccharibacteria bacterium]
MKEEKEGEAFLSLPPKIDPEGSSFLFLFFFLPPDNLEDDEENIHLSG